MAKSAFKPPGLHHHNLQQRRYFERRRKRTMLPRDTPYLRRHLDEGLEFARIAPGGRVLEVGCGMGRYTLPLAQRSLQVEAVDLSPVLLDARRRLDRRDRITLRCLDLVDHLAEMASRFEAVLSCFTPHHIHDLQRTFTAVARLLRPGGRENPPHTALHRPRDDGSKRSAHSGSPSQTSPRASALLRMCALE